MFPSAPAQGQSLKLPSASWDPRLSRVLHTAQKHAQYFYQMGSSCGPRLLFPFLCVFVNLNTIAVLTSAYMKRSGVDCDSNSPPVSHPSRLVAGQ